MEDLRGVKELLDEINAAISSYDPVLKEHARDILLERAFGASTGPRPRRAAAPAGAARDQGEGEEGGEEAPRRRPGRPKGSGTGRRGPRGGMGMNNLLGQWAPETMAERALMGAYTLSRGKADKTVTSQAINAALKGAGIPVPNITRAIESNLRAKPPLMVQKKKMGTTRQARKQYAITPEGVEFVENKLQGPGGGEE
jgi:ribosomal protein L12E/L44/L45/RPP1/RPP2